MVESNLGEWRTEAARASVYGTLPGEPRDPDAEKNPYAEWPRLENVVTRFLDELGTLVHNGDLRCLTMGQLAGEFQTKLAVTQDCNLSPAHTETAYVDCAT